MKKQLGMLGLLALILASSVVMADTESSGADCEAPLTNTCYNIYKDGKLVGTKKGVLHVRG